MSILLIHGVGGRPRSWDMVLPCLGSTLCSETVSVDVAIRAGQSMADIAHDVFERHPGSHLVVGHSFGGMLAQEMALIDQSRVLGLVLVSSIPGSTARVARINQALASRIESQGLQMVAGSFSSGLFAPGRVDRSPELGAAFVADMLQAGATSVCAALRAIADWDAVDRLSVLQCSTTVLSGDAEPDLDRQALLAKLVGGTHEVLDDTGHLAPFEAPQRVARAISELANRLNR